MRSILASRSSISTPSTVANPFEVSVISWESAKPEDTPESDKLNSGVTVMSAFLRTKYFKTNLGLLSVNEGRFWFAKVPGVAAPKAYSRSVVEVEF